MSNAAESVLGQSGVAQLRSFIERIERLNEEKKGLQEDIKDVFAEAKGQGFDTKIMKEILKLRGMSAEDIQESEALLETYKIALGMAPDLDE